MHKDGYCIIICNGKTLESLSFNRSMVEAFRYDPTVEYYAVVKKNGLALYYYSGGKSLMD